MIDWTRVDQLRREIGEEDFAEVVELFLAEVDETVTRMRAMPDAARLEADLHFLKGSALNLGFRGFSDLCHAGERAAREGRGVDDLEAIFRSFETSRATFAAERAQRAGKL